LPIAVTVSAHVKQKRERPQGTKATLLRGTRRQTSQQSATSDDDVDTAVAGVDNYRDQTTSRESERPARVDIQSVRFFNACSHYLLTQRSFSDEPF